MTEDDFKIVQQVAADAAEMKSNAVLSAMVILHVRFVSGLVAKGVLSKREHAASIKSLQETAAGYRKTAPELFAALSTATMMLGQAFDEPPEGAPS